MGMKRILAHFMHEEEQSAARNVLTHGEVTDAFALADADDAQIDQLRKAGLVIQVLGESVSKPARATAAFAPTATMADAGAGMGWATAAAPPQTTVSAGGKYRLKLMGPLLAGRKQALQDRGVDILESVGDEAYSVTIHGSVDDVEAIPFVESVRSDARRRSESLTSLGTAPPGAPPLTLDPPLYFDVRIEAGALPDPIEQWLVAQGATVVARSAGKIRFGLDDPSRIPLILANLQQQAGVDEITVHEPPTLHNEFARALLGVERRGPPAQALLSEDGTGEIVAVADTGIDEAHPDFQGRIDRVIARGRVNDASDTHGHGTHVAGSVLGSGHGANGRDRGVAPGARLVFQSLLDDEGGLGGLPLELDELFEEAYQLGARVHNNSWGAIAGSEYLFNSLEVDRFVARRRDMLVVVSAGNAGSAAIRRHEPIGFVDWLSVGSPATCKNALTVGAGRSDRVQGGLSTSTYGDLWPTRFPQPPIAAERLSGNPNELAAFSSRGPCTDRRIKPDVVAPGTDISSARSSVASPSNFAALDPNTDLYGYMSGTSMSAPLVTGCAVLVRQHYVRTRHHSPSAALLKATLINGTRKLTGPGSIGKQNSLPNYHQGFGAIDMLHTLPNPGAPWLRLEFADPWEVAGDQLDQTGSRRRFEFDVGEAGHPLRACLVWTDPPGRALQNNLDLLLELPDPAGRRKIIGNAELPERLTPNDTGNNVEIIRVEAAPTGHYVIQVTAVNLLHVPQDYALVVVGAISSPFTRTF